MKEIRNIRLETKSRAKAIIETRDVFGLGLKESKDMVDKFLAIGHVSFDDGEKIYDLFCKAPDILRYYLQYSFDCEWFSDEPDPYSNQNIREPMPETLEALAWLATLTEKEQEMVKLIGDWENPVCYGAGVC